MPKGVEHNTTGVEAVECEVVSSSVMPKGVEHVECVCLVCGKAECRVQ